jgi:hypothetical protein
MAGGQPVCCRKVDPTKLLIDKGVQGEPSRAGGSYTWPSFYYTPDAAGENVWLFLQLARIIGYAVGMVIGFADIRGVTRQVTP